MEYLHFSEDGPVYKIEVSILKDEVTLSIDTSGVRSYTKEDIEKKLG